MQIKKIQFTFITTLLLMGILSMTGCSSEFAAAVRKVTYPPDFKYVTADELRSNMHKLAFELQQLDAALLQTNNAGLEQQKQVLQNLNNIQKLATGLHAGDAGASHPFLEDGMGEFITRVQEAKVAASLEQPRYYLAGQVSGGCVNCHKINRD
jgi:hypothetical protein